MRYKEISIIVIGILFTWCSYSQENPTPVPPVPGPTGSILPGQPTPVPSQLQPTPVKPVPVPVEYTQDEFPRMDAVLRRGEIILIGSIPFTFFIITEVFDLYRFTYNGFAADDWDARFAPWPFTALVKEPYADEEVLGILVSALALAVITAGVDYIIANMPDSNK